MPRQFYWETARVTLVGRSPFDTKLGERRRHQRVELCLQGWYMLRNRHESPCWTVNLSAGGIAVLGLEQGMIGERVIANFNDLGWLEGMIARNFDNCFALVLQLGLPKREKLARTLAWLHGHRTGGVPDRRAQERVKPYRKRMVLTTDDGRHHQAALIDTSIVGAALNTDVAPVLDARVSIGRTWARVIRHFETGIAVKFEERLPPHLFKEGAIL